MICCPTLTTKSSKRGAHEAFTVDGSVNYMQIRRETVIHYPIDTPPCYDETGRRLYYPTPEYTYRENHNTETSIPYYTDMQRYTLERGDTAYSISQKFNVCVHGFKRSQLEEGVSNK